MTVFKNQDWIYEYPDKWTPISKDPKYKDYLWQDTDGTNTFNKRMGFEQTNNGPP